MVFQSYALYSAYDGAPEMRSQADPGEDESTTSRRRSSRLQNFDLTQLLIASPHNCRVVSDSGSRWAGQSCAIPSILMTSRCRTWTRKLRVQMRGEMLQPQRRLGTTSPPMPTHDQTGGNDAGRSRGSDGRGHRAADRHPEEFYERPNLFVAGFYRPLAMNFFPR